MGVNLMCLRVGKPAFARALIHTALELRERRKERNCFEVRASWMRSTGGRCEQTCRSKHNKGHQLLHREQGNAGRASANAPPRECQEAW